MSVCFLLVLVLLLFFKGWVLIMLQRLSDENNRTSMVFIIFIAAVK